MKYVTVLSLKTKARTTIPASELAPGMIEAILPAGERVWVNVHDLKVNNTPRHESLQPEMIELIKTIQTELMEVMPQSVDEWIQRFRCDAHPEREVEIWCNIVMFYRLANQRFGGGRPIEWRRDLHQLAVLLWSVPTDTVMSVANFTVMSRSECQALIEFYRTEGEAPSHDPDTGSGRSHVGGL